MLRYVDQASKYRTKHYKRTYLEEAKVYYVGLTKNKKQIQIKNQN